MTEFILRPSITNPKLWNPERPPKNEWNKIRKEVLERDNYTCVFCGHTAAKNMNIHHINETKSCEPDNLVTICVACHAIQHIGRNLDLKTIEIWLSKISQVEIVRKTREGIKRGETLTTINKKLPLSRGPHSPDSILYANDLVFGIGDQPRAYLDEPLCVVFVNFKQWQIE
ncbi:MAG: HNH endonuclease [Candidatus Omnitrophota bacterium]